MSRFCYLLLLCSLVGMLSAQGQLLEKEVIRSTHLGEEVHYSIYLPSGYERHTIAYPVLYLLHGYTDDDSGWTQFGEAHLIADQLMGNGEVPPMIIVMPDAGVSWYINSDEGEVPYEDFFIKELIPHIEATYRVRSDRQFRGLAGLSMGGYGAMIYAVKHPELFSATCPLSAAIYTDAQVLGNDQGSWDYVFGPPFTEGAVGQGRLNEHYRANSVIDIVQEGDPERFENLGIYIDCGDDDFLVDGNFRLSQVLREQGIDHEFRMRDGGHTWSYWRSALPEVLKFVGQRFRR
ncbi:MAG: alpha/beta hydrolase family protein [Bacteroidota bacterium]